ncbi:MAG: hypothetical protein JL50_08855 [Peptococcaceae bacterium BICA1-7]|nr:MAG: hypothetical protein JL50_08855 [Peptococcaceae bacterium BICA1-7]HBV97331.1 hypothetical protein [Desulfotomaculum sp.]
MLREWIERNLQDPFFQAEMYKAGINVEEGTRDFGTIGILTVFGTAYAAFCVYSYVKYIA